MSYIRLEDLTKSFKAMGGPVCVTTGSFEIPASCEVADLDWNQMDQDHRPCVHGTYLQALRLAIAPDGQLSLTRLKFFGIPFLIQVSDVRVAPSTYYQGFTLFNLIYVLTVIRCLPKLHRSDWHIVSHPWLRPLHFFVDRKIRRMNDAQNAQDVPLRDRRAELRKRGYCFTPEKPDFVSANLRNHNVVMPRLERPLSVSLGGLKPGEPNAVSAGAFEFVIRPDDGGGYSVWNGVCPHQGGQLSEGQLCGEDIRCRWHGLKFGCAKISPQAPRAVLGPFSLTLESGALMIAARE